MSTAEPRYSLDHLSDIVLENRLEAIASDDRTTTAELLAHIAAYDKRRLFAPAGFHSMHVYCTTKLLFSDDVAFKRIRAARAARRFPLIYPAIADGRLNVTGVVLLAPKLALISHSQGRALLHAAMRKSKAEIEQLIAARFPQPDVPTVIREVPTSASASSTSPTHCEPMQSAFQLAPGPVDAHDNSDTTDSSAPAPAPVSMPAPPPPPRIAPLSPKRYSLQLTMEESTREKLRRAQELLAHAVPSGDVTEVLDRALDALIEKLERRKFAKTERPRSGKRRSAGSSRYIPADVKRAVRARDGNQCTFVSDDGQRCGARWGIEFDHVQPFALGGESTLDGLRLRCRAHNQYAADLAFGQGFMSQKRGEAAHDRLERRASVRVGP